MTALTTEQEPLGYNPDRLLDSLIKKLQMKNDSALARMLEISPPVISKIRHRRIPVGASLLIRIHEVCGLGIGEMRSMMGDRRKKFRLGDSRARQQ